MVWIVVPFPPKSLTGVLSGIQTQDDDVNSTQEDILAVIKVCEAPGKTLPLPISEP